ncbi:hypothetical protein [Nonomuraea rhizosphaerae]|uniref:hypothetical protein n=1 Tax=Nonomuraea rhizosphaerae TaxID=2665663 RepID=UPI001C604201|nr:hypothetical protein [Nonomuraea rhizosphaerae]
MLLTGVSVALATVMAAGPGTLPDGLLFLETHPPAKAWETYRTTESKRLPLQPNPCDRNTAPAGDRLAARMVHYTSEDSFKYEQVIVYRSIPAARKAMRGLRADLSRCADMGKGYFRDRYFTKPLDVGDEGLRAGGRFFENGEHAVAVRRGAAIYVAGESAWPTRSLPVNRFRGLIDKAERMTVKLCDVPEVTCD